MQRLGKGVKLAKTGMSVKNTVPVSHGIIDNIAPYSSVFVNMATDLPVLACLTPFVRQQQAGKVNGMKTPNQLSCEAIEEFKAVYSIK